MDITRVAAAVVLRADGTVLLAQRPPGKAYAGYWEFPGGKLEPGETPRQALDRELAEELGLTVRRAAISRSISSAATATGSVTCLFQWVPNEATSQSAMGGDTRSILNRRRPVGAAAAVPVTS